MTPSDRRNLLLIVLSVFVLVGVLSLQGCASLSSYPEQPEMTAPISQGIKAVTFRPHWHKTVDGVNDACGPGRESFRVQVTYGCTHLYLDEGAWTCNMELLIPKDFNDIPALLVLGHEAMHCFMANHRRN